MDYGNIAFWWLIIGALIFIFVDYVVNRGMGGWDTVVEEMQERAPIEGMTGEKFQKRMALTVLFMWPWEVAKLIIRIVFF